MVWGEVLGQLPLQFDWKSLEDAKGTYGYSFYVDPALGVRSLVAPRVPGRESLL